MYSKMLEDKGKQTELCILWVQYLFTPTRRQKGFHRISEHLKEFNQMPNLNL